MKTELFPVSTQTTTGLQAPNMEAFQSYMWALLDAGAVEGRLGQQTLIPELEPALQIIHQVLAGAELSVSIDVIREPDAELLAEFEDKRKHAEESANKINKELGILYAIG